MSIQGSQTPPLGSAKGARGRSLLPPSLQCPGCRSGRDAARARIQRLPAREERPGLQGRRHAGRVRGWEYDKAILNDPPYGTERSYNGLRLATSLAKSEENSVSVFLMGDAASCAARGQTTPNGYYNIERMLKLLAAKKGPIGVCATCMDVRGIKTEMLAEGAHRSSMDELTRWTQAADKVLVF